MHTSRLGNIVIDCHSDDLLTAAKFWSEALGYAMPSDANSGDKFIQLETKPGDVQVILQRVDHDPRVHLDIETDSIDEELTRLRKLGADVIARRDGWMVMQAPSGHRFCVGKVYRCGFEEGANIWK